MEAKSLSIPGAHGPGVNVSAGQRMISVFAGGVLTSLALRQNNWSSAVIAAGGGLLIWRGFTGHCAVYQSLGMNSAEPDQLSRHAEEVITINRSPEELYAFWRNFENLPRIMSHLESVQDLGNGRSRWSAGGPAGRTLDWEAEIVRDVPNERIEWRSSADTSTPNAGSVEFRRAPGARGTQVRVHLDYQPPAGKLGDGIATLMGRSPRQEIAEDLRRFKQVMEAGEVPTTQGQSAGRPRSLLPQALRF